MIAIYRCYKCDDEVPIDRSKRLQECIEILRKQAGLPQPEQGKYTKYKYYYAGYFLQ